MTEDAKENRKIFINEDIVKLFLENIANIETVMLEFVSMYKIRIRSKILIEFSSEIA